jgi:hypothetical protein
MNEHIKQLALQALKHPDNDNDGLTVFDNDELEKFAELIVQECAKVLKENWTMGGSAPTISAIKQHFGVEE